MKLTSIFFLIWSLAPLFLSGCVTRAPTKFELDRRAGLVPEVEAEKKAREAQGVRTLPAISKGAQSPRRVEPRIEKIWVYDQELSAHAWMQGTYVFLEVEPSRWSMEEKSEVVP